MKKKCTNKVVTNFLKYFPKFYVTSKDMQSDYVIK